MGPLSGKLQVGGAVRAAWLRVLASGLASSK